MKEIFVSFFVFCFYFFVSMMWSIDRVDSVDIDIDNII